MPETPHEQVIAKTTETLKSATDTFQKSRDFIKLERMDKIKRLPDFAEKMANHIQFASAHIKLLRDTEWNSPDLKRQAESLIKELDQVRTRLRYILKQELSPIVSDSVHSLQSQLQNAKMKHEAGDSLDYISILEQFAYLEIAQKITEPSLYAKAMKSVFGADVESAPEEVKDYGIHVDYEVVRMFTTADALKGYRTLLQKGGSTSEKILARPEVSELQKRLAA